MAKVDFFGQPLLMATRPYKGGFYLKRTVPWDTRRGGYGALSDRQKAHIENNFVPAAQASARGGAIYEECKRDGYAEGTKGMNECRFRKVGQQLRRGSGRREFARASPREIPNYRMRSPNPRGRKSRYERL